MENKETLETLVESMFSNSRPRSANEMWPSYADWAVIDKEIYSQLKSRINNVVFSDFPYLGRSIMNGISSKLVQKATEFGVKGDKRTLSDEQVEQIVDPIVDSIVDFVQNVGKGLHSPPQRQ